MKTFSTNEFLSGFAIGIILKNSEAGIDEMEKTKHILSSVLGSVGDRLIYRLILPVIALFSVNKFIITGFKPDQCTFALIAVLILSFNVFNFCIRYIGISEGYQKGLNALKIFRSAGYKRTVHLLAVTRDILTAFLIINLIIYLKASNILLFFLD